MNVNQTGQPSLEMRYVLRVGKQKRSILDLLALVSWLHCS